MWKLKLEHAKIFWNTQNLLDMPKYTKLDERYQNKTNF